ncbi:MAG: hypothetical protein KJO78_16330, partial [Alphaproteobacteria bacterium]|nr:hypothetical protein [Alphaproteobacteria bacterium]
MRYVDTWRSCPFTKTVAKSENHAVFKVEQFILVVVEGELLHQHVDWFLTVVMESAELSPLLPTLIDLRGVDFSKLSSGTIRSLSDSIKKSPFGKKARVARLVSSSLGFGLMRMHQTISHVSDAAPEENTLVTDRLEDA